MQQVQKIGVRAAVPLLFFVSGGCTLVYQIVWVRMLVPVFGTSVFTVSTVLAAFMAGLALGSALFGRVADRSRSGLRIYAYLELGIGATALALPFVLHRLDGLYVYLYRSLDGAGPSLPILRFLIVFLVLLVPTTLMGGSLPVLVKFVARRPTRIGWSVGGLYAINTLGASAGCAVTVLFLLARLGVGGTTLLAAAGNLGVAGVAFLISRRMPDSVLAPAPVIGTVVEATPAAESVAAVETPPVAEPENAVETDATPGDAIIGQVPLLPGQVAVRAVFWGFALSGFAALGYELVWTRLLSTVAGITTTQSLSVILVAFLFGLAAGGALGARFADRFRRPLLAFGIVELLLGLFGLSSIAALGRIPEILATLTPLTDSATRLFGLSVWWAYLLQVLLAGFAIMLLPTCLMGALFPIAGRLQAAGLGNLGRRIGNILAANTAGALLGALVTGFVLIPLAGTQGSVELLASINLLVGAVLLMLDSSVRLPVRLGLLGGAMVPVLLLALFVPSAHLVELLERSVPGTRLLYYEESASGTVTVHESENGERLLKVNGAGEVPTDHASIQTFRLLGNLPMLLHPDPREVLVIAFGGGVTLSAVLAHRPRRLDCVEVVPAVVDAAPYFEEYNNRLYERLDSPGFEIIHDDGRNHLLRTERRYDVIAADATHPATADSWVLYTREFYELARARLNEGGYFAQWLPLHGLSAEDYRTVLRTVRTVFPHISLWLTRRYSVVLATPSPLRIDMARMRSRISREDVWPGLAEVELEDPFAFLATLALDETGLAGYVGSGPINTDDRPRASFYNPRKIGTNSGLPALASLLPYLTERPDRLLAEAMLSDETRLARRFLARRHSLLGLVALKRGDRERALRELNLALELDGSEREAQRTRRKIRLPVESARQNGDDPLAMQP